MISGGTTPDQRMQLHLQRLRELEHESIGALFAAAGEYHAKHSRGPGAAAVCICGAGCGGSRACSGLAAVKDFFVNAQLDDPLWVERFQQLRACFQNR